MLSPRRELWHAAGRTAREGRLRRIAQVGLLLTAPVLYVGSLLWQLVLGGASAPPGEPLAYVFAPARDAYACGCDVALVGYLLWQWALITLLWGYFGGALQRLAAVQMARGRREAPRAAYAYARGHWRGFAGARLALLVGAVLPLGLAILLATVGRLDGWLGGLLLAVAIVAVVFLALLAVLVGTGCLLGGFLTFPTVACEDSDTFDALSRAFGYAAAGLPRLCLVRLGFFLGLLLGSGWRLLLTAAAVGLTLACIRLGAGADALTRIQAVWGAQGAPADADRLGLTFGDYAAAVVLGFALFALVLRWLSDYVSRVCCAQVGAYLVLRAEIDGVGPDVLRTKPTAPTFRTAEQAGFVEAGRVGGE